MHIQTQLADVIVVNYGIHYLQGIRPNGEYAADMERMLEQLDEFAARPGKSAVFRDTTSQHHVLAGSDWLPEERNHPVGPRGCQCAPFEANAVDIAVTIGRVVAQILARFPRVGFLPWSNVTRDRWDMHEGPFCAFQMNKKHPGASCCDCVHYCYTPMFWKHFFHHMFITLDKTG